MYWTTAALRVQKLFSIPGELTDDVSVWKDRVWCWVVVLGGILVGRGAMLDFTGSGAVSQDKEPEGDSSTSLVEIQSFGGLNL